MNIYTSTLRRGGKVKGIPLDISVKTGDKTFAPSWKIVMDHKSGKITDKEYKKIYLAMIQRSFWENYDRWLEVMMYEEVTFLCYCPRNPKFCHRLILPEFIIAHAPRKIEKVIYYGEL